MFDFLVYKMNERPSKKLTYRKLRKMEKKRKVTIAKIVLFKDGLGIKSKNLKFSRQIVYKSKDFSSNK